MGKVPVPVMNLTTLQRFMYNLWREDPNLRNPKWYLGCERQRLPHTPKPNIEKLGVDAWLKRQTHETYL